MNNDEAGMVEADASVFGDASVFLHPGMEVSLKMYEEEPVLGVMPTQVTCTVIETEGTVKGQTAAGGSKPAVLENGVRIQVPPYVAVGESVVVDSKTRTFLSRG